MKTNRRLHYTFIGTMLSGLLLGVALRCLQLGQVDAGLAILLVDFFIGMASLLSLLYMIGITDTGDRS